MPEVIIHRVTNIVVEPIHLLSDDKTPVRHIRIYDDSNKKPVFEICLFGAKDGKRELELKSKKDEELKR